MYTLLDVKYVKHNVLPTWPSCMSETCDTKHNQNLYVQIGNKPLQHRPSHWPNKQSIINQNIYKSINTTLLHKLKYSKSSHFDQYTN